MTKKDYIMLARVIGESVCSGSDRAVADKAAWILQVQLVDNLTRELQRDNPRFDVERFRDAIEKARVSA